MKRTQENYSKFHEKFHHSRISSHMNVVLHWSSKVKRVNAIAKPELQCFVLFCFPNPRHQRSQHLEELAMLSLHPCNTKLIPHQYSSAHHFRLLFAKSLPILQLLTRRTSKLKVYLCQIGAAQNNRKQQKDPQCALTCSAAETWQSERLGNYP